uniref:Glial cell derived neurotrophic factor b n=1 Tax=Cyprinus carpio carpio TaxID=630221 RepID=A0A9J7XQE3_CYPCA
MQTISCYGSLITLKHYHIDILSKHNVQHTLKGHNHQSVFSKRSTNHGFLQQKLSWFSFTGPPSLTLRINCLFSHSAFIHRSKRSPKRRGFLRSKMDRKRPSRDEREKGKGRACALRQVQLKVSDLGLGYWSQEELIFSYCSGVCINPLTNYDKILTSLAGNGKNILHSSPPTACCRPVQYDADLSFLDDSLIYHTMKRHSARKCGCV